MKTALVTGGCGFIGSHFIDRFLKTHPDWRIINLDKLTYAGNPANTKRFDSDPRYEFVQGDICDENIVGGVMKKAQAVVHFAAETHVDRSIESSDDFLMTNIFGTRVLLDASRKAGIERFVHVSTDEVYGSLETGSADEEAPLMPNSPYSASKAAGDLLVRSYWVTFKHPGIIVRSTNNYGPYQFPEKVIPLFVTNLMENKKVPLYGTGENSRDWIFVEDNVAAIELVFDKGETGQTYNIGAGNETTNCDLTKKILALMKRGEDMIQPVEDRLGHDLRYSVKVDKVSKLGFRMEWSFEKGLQKTVEWYQQNTDWWKPLKKDKFTVK